MTVQNVMTTHAICVEIFLLRPKRWTDCATPRATLLAWLEVDGKAPKTTDKHTCLKLDTPSLLVVAAVGVYNTDSVSKLDSLRDQSPEQ